MSAPRPGKPTPGSSQKARPGARATGKKAAAAAARKRAAGACTDAVPIADLKDAKALLQGFTKAGRVGRARRPRNFQDPIQVATVELACRITRDPRAASSVGAWLARMKQRGAGQCTPLLGAGEGLAVLVLDAQAVADMWQAASEHQECLARYDELQADLAELRRLRGEGEVE